MDLEQARTNMVEQQIRTWEVLDQDVLDLLYVVPREEFVPAKQRALAFSDMQLPIGENERMWEPKLEARVLQELELHRTDRVLEVGTGSGYLTALLAHRTAHVFSVEIKPTLAAFGRRNLEHHGTANVTLEVADAARGWRIRRCAAKHSCAMPQPPCARWTRWSCRSRCRRSGAGWPRWSWRGASRSFPGARR